MAYIRLERVSLQYPIYNTRSFSLRTNLLRIGTGGLLERDTAQVMVVTALKDLSLSLETGDRLGLIGPNGAGKSTLLRLAAGILAATSGSVAVSGRIGTLFELGAGYDADLSGWENIQRVGRLLGMTPREIALSEGEIAEFTELGDFLSLPVRTYSAGMQTRLLFAIATASQPDILLVDEVFGAGDAAFQQRAAMRLQSLFTTSKILMFATHSDELISQLCSKCLWLEHGAMRAYGPTDDVLAQYQASVNRGAPPA